MIRIKTCQFGLLFTGINDCMSNVKYVNNNIHVIIYSIDIKTYQVHQIVHFKMYTLLHDPSVCVCSCTVK